MVDYTDFLSKPVGEIKEFLLPVGHYAATFGEFNESWLKESSGSGGKAKRPMLVAPLAIQSAYDDVDTSAIGDTDLSKIKRSNNFILDADFGMVQLRKAMEAAGIEMDPAEGIGTYLPQLSNRPVKIYVTHRPRDNNNPEAGMIDQIDKILPVT